MLHNANRSQTCVQRNSDRNLLVDKRAISLLRAPLAHAHVVDCVWIWSDVVVCGSGRVVLSGLDSFSERIGNLQKNNIVEGVLVTLDVAESNK